MLGYGKWFVRMFTVRIPKLDHRRNDFPRHKKATCYLVSGHVAYHQSKVWDKRLGATEGSRTRELPDGLDMVA